MEILQDLCLNDTNPIKTHYVIRDLNINTFWFLVFSLSTASVLLDRMDTTIVSISMKLCSDMFGPQKMNPKSFIDFFVK